MAFSQTEVGQATAHAIIFRRGGPVYGAEPARPEVIVERQPDGSVRRGRVVNRGFVPE